MSRVRVAVRLHDVLVEDRVVPVRHVVRIGEARGARVSFPGADLAVLQSGTCLAVRGRKLAPGQGIGVSLGPVRVWIEHVVGRPPSPGWRRHVDLPFFALTLLMTVGALWVETLGRVMEVHAPGSPLVRAWNPRAAPAPVLSDAGNRTAAVTGSGEVPPVTPAPTEAPDGPQARPDDHRTGVAFYEWYRAGVPVDPGAVDHAVQRVEAHPDDPAHHLALADLAYAADDWDLAATGYRWLVERGIGGTEILWRLARTERRRGHHVAEATLCRAILAQARDARCLAALATVSARLGRYDEATRHLAEARAGGDDGVPGGRYGGPQLAVAEAVVAVEEGREADAIRVLEAVVADREALTPEQREELQRDLALDPAFSRLRADGRFRAMLARQLGAAAPRPFHR